jgi:hypothetical protein
MKALRAGSVMRMSVMAVLMAFVMTPHVANATTVYHGAISALNQKAGLSDAMKCALIKQSQCPKVAGGYSYERCLKFGRVSMTPGPSSGCCLKWDCGWIH